jgi:hypothetical protein
MSDLKAKHWEKYGAQAEFQVKHQAAKDAPPMGMGQSLFSHYAVRLVQEAYNLIIVEHDTSQKLPMCPEKGVFDFETSLCIGKFQAHFKLKNRSSKADSETLAKMDELLVRMETEKLKPTFKKLWA